MTPEQALHEAIEGRAPLDRLTADQRQLVRLALRCERIEVAGPGAVVLRRMAARFDRFLDEERRSGAGAWLAAWLGLGPLPRPLVERLAAAGLLAGVVGFGGAAATGQAPAEVLEGLGRFAASAIENLLPHDPADPGRGSGMEPVDPEVSPTPPAPPTPAATVAPGQTPLAGAAEPAGAVTSPTIPAAVTPGAPAQDGPSATAPAAPPAQAPAETETPTPVPASTSTPAFSPTPTAEPPVVPGDLPAQEPAAEATPTPATSPSVTPSPSPEASATPTPGATTATYSAGEAGTVVVRYTATSLDLVDVLPAPGWSYKVEDVKATSFKVEFEQPGRKVEFKARLEDGAPVTTVTESAGESED